MTLVSSDVGRNERIEAELFDGDTEFGELAFIGLNHVRVRLPDLLQFSLDFTNRLVLQLLNLLKRTTDHAKSLRVNPSRRQDLIRLGVLRLQALLDRL